MRVAADAVKSEVRNMIDKREEGRSFPAPDVYNTRKEEFPSSYKGINNPEIELPAFNPPVPNRAWTAMRQGLDIDELTPEERAELNNFPGV